MWSRIMITLVAGIAVTGTIAGCRPKEIKRQEHPPATPPSNWPPAVKQVPPEVMKGLLEATPTVSEPVTENDAISRAREFAVHEGFPLEKALKLDAHIIERYWTITFYTSNAQAPAQSGGGFEVLVDYVTGHAVYSHWPLMWYVDCIFRNFSDSGRGRSPC